MDTAHGGVVEGVPQAEREDAQRDNRSDGGQGIRMSEGKINGQRQQPEGREPVDVESVAKERMAVAFSSPGDRVDGETEPREQRQTVAKDHTAPLTRERASRIAWLKADQDGDANSGDADADVFPDSQRFSQEDDREERDQDRGSIDNGQRVGNGGVLQRGNVKVE